MPREEQFTSAVVIGELFHGAFRTREPERQVHAIAERVLAAVTVLPYDVAVARVFGEVGAGLARRGTPLADADLQIAATAVYHGLRLVTGNVRHFARVPGLEIETALARARG